VFGRNTEMRRKQRRPWGYHFLHVAVDDHSGWPSSRFTRMSSERRREFLLDAAAHFAELGEEIERVMTDRNLVHQLPSVPRRAEMETPHLTTRTYRWQTKGKAERFIPTI
jgi:hypothetical protein